MDTKIFHSKSFNSNITNFDDTPVIAKIQVKGHTQKSYRYQILQFKQIIKYSNNRKLHETSKRNNKKSNKYNIKPGRMERQWKALKTSAETNLDYNDKEKKSRDPNILHLSSIQNDINIELNSIKDEQKKKLLKKTKKEDNDSNSQYHQKWKKQQYEAVKNIKRLAPKEKNNY